ncbi:hypothetical protein P4S64_20400 [Vibrio sp. M60_M31a]
MFLITHSEPGLLGAEHLHQTVIKYVYKLIFNSTRIHGPGFGILLCTSSFL